MAARSFRYFLPLLTVLLFPGISFAATQEALLQPGYLSPDLQIVSDKPFSLEQQGEVFLLRVSKGVSYVVHPFDSTARYGELRIVLKSNILGDLTILANATTSGNHSYQYETKIEPSNEFLTFRFSLHHPFYDKASDFAMKFIMASDGEIIVREISFVKHSTLQKLGSAFRDYFHTPPYSGFTVNVFATPQVFGESAFLYLLPVFVVLVLLLLFSTKYRKKALVGLVLLWLVSDFRMNYEFGKYISEDYRTWVKPARAEKSLRTYGDFYVFADWLKTNIPKDLNSANFYYLDNEHFPRLLQYYLYPVQILPKKDEAKAWVVYHRQDIKDKLIGEGMREVASFSEDSGVFIKP